CSRYTYRFSFESGSVINNQFFKGRTMKKSFEKIMQGYEKFKLKYANDSENLMERLAEVGQKPEIMMISCCDSRVDPAILLQCRPGELFIVRNVANIVPPFINDHSHHGTSSALEFGINFLKIPHIIILGHSQCGGIEACLNAKTFPENDFISDWVSQLDPK